MSQLIRLYLGFLAIIVTAAKIEAYCRDRTDGVKKHRMSHVLLQGTVDTEAKQIIYASSEVYTNMIIHNTDIYIYLKLRHSILSCGCWEKGRINPHQKFKIPSDVEITDTMHSPLRHERNLNFIIQAYGTF